MCYIVSIDCSVLAGADNKQETTEMPFCVSRTVVINVLFLMAISTWFIKYSGSAVYSRWSLEMF